MTFRNLAVALTVGAMAFGGSALAQGKSPGKTEAKAGGKAGPAKGSTEVTWWGHAAWFVKTPGGAVFAIDPWLKNPTAPKDLAWPASVDAVLVTHGHFDHTGDATELARRSNAPVIASFELANLLAPEDKAMGANAGGTIRIRDAAITLVEAVHSSSFGSGKDTHYAGAPVGFIIAIDNGPTLYHAGDTGLFSSMELIGEAYKPTFAMLPIGGQFTMDPPLAARAAKLLKVKTVLPMHYGTFPALKGTPAELEAAMKKVGAGAKVVVAEPGKPITL